MNQEKLIEELATRFGYLPYMIERYLKMFGLEETIRYLEANEKPLIPSIRVNTLKIGPHELKGLLERKGFVLELIDGIPNGFKIIKQSLNVGSLHEYLQGYFYIQNIASMIAPIVLNPKSNEVVIDMCSAPGGKATHLAELMKNEGKLILIERNLKRIAALEINVRRMGVKNTIIINMDARKLKKLKIKADKILLDAPCTGEGLIRQDSYRKKSKTYQDIKKMARIQKELLLAGLNMLKTNGELLYCTCSIAPEENEFVIDECLNNSSQYQIVKIESPLGIPGFNKVFDKNLIKDLQNSVRIYPHLHDTIGFFFCLIKKEI
ncbi:MAG: RsmB/NOP family class I SAM-dependent RNA methyltransferase [Promethearchaeota archaeon]